MPISKNTSAAFLGLDALAVDIEVDVATSDKPSFVIVGLPDMAVKESKDRVTTALKNCGVSLNTQQCTINLAPGDLRKNGAIYDLPIALGVMHAMGRLKNASLDDYLIVGELGLGGELRPLKGALSIALLAKKLRKKGVLLSTQNAQEAAHIQGIPVFGIDHLNQAISFAQKPTLFTPTVAHPLSQQTKGAQNQLDFADILGQPHLKRAAEIAAAGGHNFLLSGPPGAGKTMIAKAFTSILPPLLPDEAIEVTKIHSLSGLLPHTDALITTPPFRAPHHTISYAGMIGGGATPRPGEVSLAHLGVLFLDELPEFSRLTLEVLRQPLEDGHVTISRARGSLRAPTRFIFIGAMNPCPCGYLGHPSKPCRDSELQIEKYKKKISGPLLDRIDMHLTASPVKYEELTQTGTEEPSASIQGRVLEARAAQQKRLGKGLTNSRCHTKKIKQSLSASCHTLLKDAMEQVGISARAFDRILKVARTIADLDYKAEVSEDHLMEAISYRT